MVELRDLLPAALAALAALALVGGAEWLQARRVHALRFLLFGARGRARAWVRLVPWLRALAAAAVAAGLVVLLRYQSVPEDEIDPDREPAKHLMIALDASPSMYLEDAGPDGKLSRWKRAKVLLDGVMQRLDMQQTRVSIVAFYTDAKPVVLRSFDMQVVANVLDGLPLEHAFRTGRTKMQEGVQAAIDQTRGWPPGSTVLLVVSDGDTVPGRVLPMRTPAIADVLVLGVGDPHRGSRVAGRTSRQDHASLQQLAVRLGGRYHDGNRLHLPSDVVRNLTAALPQLTTQSDLRDLALAAVGGGGAMLALLPLLMVWFGRSRSGTLSGTLEAAGWESSKAPPAGSVTPSSIP